jgi:hypothetical protein
VAATVFTTMKGATLVFGDSLADVTTDPLPATALDGSCQVVDARDVPTAATETAAATLCADAVTRVTGIDHALQVSFFEDWTSAAGFSWFLDDNAGETHWFALTLLDAGSVTGQVQIVPGEYGGAAGAPLQTQVSMPISNRATTKPALAARATAAKKAS